MEELINIIMNYVEADEIGEDTSFKNDLGMSSFDTVCMIAEIKNTIGVQLEPGDFIKYKTVGSMAGYINSLK